MAKLVPIGTLPEGTRFRTRHGDTGTLLRVGSGSVQVEIDRLDVREFVPRTGPNVGKKITIAKKDRGPWALGVEVEPIREEA